MSLDDIEHGLLRARPKYFEVPDFKGPLARSNKKTVGKPWENGDLYSNELLVGGLEPWNGSWLSRNSWEWNSHPNWRTRIFFRGIGIPPTRWDIGWIFWCCFSRFEPFLERFSLIGPASVGKDTSKTGSATLVVAPPRSQHHWPNYGVIKNKAKWELPKNGTHTHT